MSNFTLFKGKISNFFLFLLITRQNFVDFTYYIGADVHLVSTGELPLPPPPPLGLRRKQLISYQGMDLLSVRAPEK